MSTPNPKVDWYFVKNKQWRDEIDLLRKIVLSTDLTEELKWGVPCYTLDGANVVLIHVFKEYCALLFHKGVLLKDPQGILVQQTKNVQSARQLRFKHIGEVVDQEALIKSYVKEAITIEKSGLKVEFKKELDPIPAEFQIKLDSIPALKKAFHELTPGRQRGYILYFSSAKQSKTRESRVEKYMENILAGKGVDDK